ncbi:hypothetical protein CDAR_446601 [Caerostris darwini]|uniref:Uncharacterized protein n=1 Tax=Caerostris darwini TaxID=1538125 RepID=A0AAV4PPY7_9ARAC|nr:hypothetical protein CDAR_446601 [Caerostris darwini]
MDLTIGCSKDDALSLFPISKLICTNPPSLAAEQSLPLIHSDTDSNSALAGYWSFLITELGVHTGYILSNPTSPHFNRVDGKFTFQGVDRRKFSRFAIRRSEFLWTAASYPRWRSLIASKTLLWMGAAAALWGLKASVLCGEWGRGRRLSMAWSV